MMVPQKESELVKDLALSLGWQKGYLMVSHLAAVMVPQKESELVKDLALSLGWQKGYLMVSHLD
jgi:hypothetical protein